MESGYEFPEPSISPPPMNSIGLAPALLALAAAAIAATVIFSVRSDRITGAAAARPAAAPSPTADGEPAPPSSGQPAAAPAPTASADGGAPHATASPPAANAVADASALAANEGLLVVESATPANVWVNGKAVGASGEPIRVGCGARYVRLATPAASGAVPNWLGTGRSVVVACRAATRVALDATR